MAIRSVRTSGVSLSTTSLPTTGIGALPPTFGYRLPGLGFTTPAGPGVTPTTSGGGAPGWACALIGRASCSYADLIAAGLGHLFGGGGAVPGTGGSPVPGGTGLVANCPDGSFPIGGMCADLIPGGSVSGGGMVLSTGEAVMGRFGAALVPSMRSTSVATCPRGAVLGVDGLCYNKSQLRKSDRKWVPARKPLLTGGDLNAISRAARAANRVKVQQKRLQKLGLLAKPKARSRAPVQARATGAHTHGDG